MKIFAVAVAALIASTIGSVSQAQTTADFAKLGFASEAEMQNYFKIVDVKVTDAPVIARDQNLDAPVSPSVNPAVALGGGLLDTLGPVLLDPSGVSAWIAFGKKLWEVVVANKAVVDVRTASVTVLPNDKNLWAQMAGWRGPNTTSYNISFVNGMGMTVVNHTYSVSYNYGGKLNGKGAYLANATILPTAVNVLWGFNLNSNVEVGQILNAGTVESPVPAVDLQLKWSVKALFQESTGVDSFYVKGDGSMNHVSSSSN